MDEQNKSTNLQAVDSNELQLAPTPVLGGVDQTAFETDSLSLQPDSLLVESEPTAFELPKSPRRRWLTRANYTLIALLIISAAGLAVNGVFGKDKTARSSENIAGKFNTVQLPLSEFTGAENTISIGTSAVVINGPLKLNQGVVVSPSVQPNSPTAGQLYFDQNTNQLAYYNGTKFVPLSGSEPQQQIAPGQVVENIGGLTGQVALGGGLTVVGNQLISVNNGVLSVGGQTGDIAVGGGLGLSGNTLQNTGVLDVLAGTGITVVGDGNGNFTISNSGAGSGTVASGGGTNGRIAKFTNAQNIEDSLLSESGTTITVNGYLSVSGGVTLAQALTVSNGGTGATSFGANGVLVGNATGPISSIVAGGAGLCLTSTVGAPTWAACTSASSAVTSLNGLTGVLTIANATGSVSTITIDDAAASTKGIASFDSTNFAVIGGAVNTVQNISVTSTPTFAGVNTNNITPSASLTVGSSSQSLSLLGDASSIFAATGGGQTTTVGFSGSPLGAVRYNFDRSAAPNTYEICTSAGNCVGGGSGVTTAGGTTDRLSKFTGAQAIGDSSLSDNGSIVTVNGTANLVVQGGTATLGTLTQAGNLAISDGSSNTVSIVATGLGADRIYTLPDAGGSAAFCLDSGNCIGGGSGGAPNAGEYLVANLSGTLTNERALAGGSNISLTDGGANGSMTVATVQNPTFTTSVTTPVLQSSGVLTLSSTAGQIIAIDAGTTIELQDSTNVTGSLDVSTAFNAGAGNAFQVNAAGAIIAATGVSSSGTITFSGLNCTTFANGGALTTNGSGQLSCSDDDGGAGGAISGSGSSGTIPVFNGAQSITNSIITQSGTTISIAGDLTLTTALSVANGGTGAVSFTSRGLLYGNGAGAVQVTNAGTSGQVLIADGSGVPVFASFSGDVAVSNTGATTIQANSVALGTDTTGNYVANLGTVTGLNISGNTGEGSTPNLSVAYGAIASTAVQGNVTLTCPAGTGNLAGGGDTITLGAGGSCSDIGIVNNPNFAVSVTTPSMILTGAGSDGTIQIGNLGQGTLYTLPDPGSATATICISTGNCPAAGAAGGDLTGTYPNPTIAKLQGTNLAITAPSGGNILVYNATDSAWENKALSGDVAISEAGLSTIQANSVALGTDTTGNYVLGLTAGNGTSITGSAGEGWSPTVAVLYGSSANTAVQGNTSISVTAGTNLTGGGNITLGAGGSVTLDVASSPVFSGTLAVQGATATIGTSSQQGSVVLNDGSANTGTLKTAALGQDTTFTLPDPGGSTAVICLTTGNCASSGGGVTTSGGTTDRLSKFTGSQTIGDSSLSDNGSTVTINGTANLVVQGGTTMLGTLSQAGTLSISDGSSNTVSIVTSALSADRVYTLPDAGGNATLCVNSGNCIGGTGSAPNTASYLVAALDGTLTDERALANGSNISITDGGAGGNMTVATVQNPTFTTSVTTPILQSSGALTITSAAGQIIAIDAGTTIELQDSTNITGSLDVSASFAAGTGNAFQVSAAGVVTATGITSSGTITFSGLNCTTFINGGALTTNSSGQLTCSDDDGGSGGAISGAGTAGTIPVFSGTNTIADSIVTQSGTSITIAGDLTLNTALTVANGGTGATGFTARGLLYGNGTGAVQVTSAGTSGQVLVADGSGVPTFVSFGGDVAVSNTGTTTIQVNSVALGTDTTGNYVNSLGTLTGLTTSGNSGEGSTPTLSVTYGAIANTAVQGNVTLTCPTGTGNLIGGANAVTLGTGGTCNALNIVVNPTFATSVTSPAMILTGVGSSGTVEVGNLGQDTVYTLPDPGSATATICISTGNCTAAGAAGGDLTGSYPNPTVAKLQGTNLTIAGPSAGHVLIYNGTNSAWENKALTGDVGISETGLSTIQVNSVALGTDTTGNYVLGLSAGNGASVTGSAGEGWTPTVSVLYGSSANTAVQGNTSLTVTAGTNITGGGVVTLGAGGTVTVNVANSPTFSGVLTVQGATATIGTAAQQGSVVLNDGSSNTGTLQTATLGQDTVYTLPDAGGPTATICLTTGNCAGTGSGVTTTGGTTNRVSKFTGAQALGDSTISDNGSLVTVNGSANFVVQGGTVTVGTLSQAGTLEVSDGSSNKVSIVASALASDRTYTLPDAGGPATFCLDTGNCIGSGGGGAPNNATYLLTSLNGTLSNERALANGSNIAFTDAGANGNFTVATVQNPTFTTSVTTPALQSSGALTITSGSTTVAIDASTTIELQDSTNITGSLDVSVALNVGTANAFQISSGGAITAATGITSSGTIIFSGLNCTTFANGGALTTNGSGQLACSDDDGGSGSAITGTGSNGTIPVFTGTNTIANSIVTQSGTTISVAGDLTLSTQLSVANGGTGAVSLTSHGVLYGNNTAAVGVTTAGTGGQVLIADASGVPTFASFTGDVAVSNTGATTIQANSVALGTDTTGNYVSLLGTLTGLTTSGNTGEGSTPTLSVTYGSIASTAVQGNTSLNCPSGSGNLTGGGTAITLGIGGTCGAISTVNNPTFSTSVTTPLLTLTGAGSNGSLQVASLGQATAYTLPDPSGPSATICISTGNCNTAGTAGGDLTGSYPNPTIAKLQGGTLTITTPTGGNLLMYNGSAWVNQSMTSDVTLSSGGVATIATGAVTSGKIADGTIANVDLASGSFTNITGVGTLGSLTVVGATNINTSGAAGTSIGNAGSTFQLASTALNISSVGALTGVSGITTAGGYVQSGATANTFTGASSFTAAGTALSVTNNATIGGVLTANTITPNSALTIGAAGQSFTLQGNGTSVIKSTDTGNTTTVDFTTPTAATTLHFPALAAGSYTLCTTSGNCAGVGSTLQTAYNNSTSTEITLDATRGALTVRDTSGGLGANLLEVQNNLGSTTYFNVTATGTNTTGTITSSGTITTTGGNVVSAGDVAVNGGDITSTGALNITPTGALVAGATGQNATLQGAITTVTSAGAGNDIILNSADTIELQDSTNVTGNLDVSGTLAAGTANAFQVVASGNITTVGTYNTNTFDGSTLTFGTAGTATIQPAAAQALTITAHGNSTWSTDSGTLSIQAATTLNLGNGGGTAINIGTNNAAHTIGIGNTGATGVQAITVGGSGNTGNTLALEAGTAAGAIQIGAGATAHGIQIGNSASGDNDILLGSANSASTLIMEAGTAVSALQIANGATSHGIQIGSNVSGDNDILLGSANAGSTVSIEAGTGAAAINIGNGATAHGIQIGTGAAVQTVSVGSTNGASVLNLNAGSGNALLNATAGTVTIQTTTSGAINIKPGGSSNIVLGTSDTTGTQLVLDTKTDIGDPVGVNGAMYYNSAYGRFRCYQNNAWTDCIAGSASEYMRAESTAGQTGTDIDATADHVKFANVHASSGGSISLDTSSAYVEGGSGASVGRFTLAAGKTYLLRATIPWASYSGPGSVDYRWQNATTGIAIGMSGGLTAASSGAVSDGGYAEGIITTTTTTVVELRFSNLVAVTAVGSTSNGLLPSAFIEVLSDGTQIAQFTGATASTAGTSGFVPGAAAGQQGSVLLGDGTWSTGVTFLSGAATFQNATNSTTAFRVLRDSASSSVPLFVIDTSNSRVYIGNPTADSTGALLVLDTKNSTGDPTEVDGAMYYNSSTHSFRCGVDTVWVGCVGGLMTSTTAIASTVANTATETLFSPSYTMPANYCQSGRVLHITAAGTVTNSASGANNELQLRFKMGITPITASDGDDWWGVGTNNAWSATVTVVCPNAPATNATVTGQGIFAISYENQKQFAYNPAVVNTTTSQALTMSADWQVASPSNSITLKTLVIESSGP